MIEVYDLDRTVDSKLANISTRGLVQSGDNVMIGGLIVAGADPQEVIVRAIGPSLPLSGKLSDPMLELYDGNGALVQANDNWRSDQEEENYEPVEPVSAARDTGEAAARGRAKRGKPTVGRAADGGDRRDKTTKRGRRGA